MAAKLPPLPVGVAPGSGYWNDWYEKLRTLVNSIVTNGISWALISAKPTTLVGFGITDAAPLTHVGTGGAAHLDVVAAGASGFMTGADKTKLNGAEVLSNKNIASGYAGLNGVSRTIRGVDTTDDLIVDLATKGLVLKDTAATPVYWRVTISTSGVLTTTSLGTTKP